MAKALGGFGTDGAYGMVATTNGFIVVGESFSNNGDVSSNYGESDLWLVSMDLNGNLIWEKNYGGSGSEIDKSIVQTNDGGFAILSRSNSSDIDVPSNHGASISGLVAGEFVIDVQNILGQKLYTDVLLAFDENYNFSIPPTYYSDNFLLITISQGSKAVTKRIRPNLE